IVRILAALFFIKTDYVTTPFYPNLLDLERGRILCIAALWNTFKPACTAPKHRSVNFLLPAHPHPDDIAHRRIALFKAFHRRLTNHSCKVANYLRIWAAPRKLSANGSTLFANGESRSLMICGWDGNLFTRSKTVAGSAADEVSWAWLCSTEAGLPR